MRVRPIFLLVPVLLVIPAAATVLSDEFNWGASDFFIMGVMLITVLGLMDWIWRKYARRNQRIGLMIFILFLFFLVWAEMAVGIFGSPIAGN